jgi:hypothetical protein
MKRLSLALCAAAVVFAATAPAQANFTIIRWNTTGLCETWNNSLPTKPIFADYKVLTRKPIPNYAEAVRVKMDLVKRKACNI